MRRSSYIQAKILANSVESTVKPRSLSSAKSAEPTRRHHQQVSRRFANTGFSKGCNYDNVSVKLSLVRSKLDGSSRENSRALFGARHLIASENLTGLLHCKTQPVVMLSRTISRFMSSSRKNSTGSGSPIKDEKSNPRIGLQGIKKIDVNACGDLYVELAKSKPGLYASAPQGRGIDFQVQYYDSYELLDPPRRATAPVVCLLHGAPGQFGDFSSLIQYLTAKNFRVVAPNFPDYSATFDYSFRHSPAERLDLLIKFFEALNLSQIDMIIGHSSAVYTIFELLDRSLATDASKVPIRVKSLGLFSTPSYNLPPNMVATPFRLFTLKLFDYPFLRPIIMALIHTFVKFQGIQNRVDRNKIENLLIAASAVGYSDSNKMVSQLKLVRKFQIPTFVLFGCKDRLLPMRCFDQLQRDLGITHEKQVRRYGPDGQLVCDAEKLDEIVEVSHFETGGHYTFQSYAEQVNEDVYKFLLRKVLLDRLTTEL